MLSQMEKILGRALSSTEIGRVLAWLSDYGASPEIVVFAGKYCADKSKTSLKYIERGGKEWADEGLQTVDQVNEKLQELMKSTIAIAGC